jgi:ATP:ADP antiporter, AAA family
MATIIPPAPPASRPRQPYLSRFVDVHPGEGRTVAGACVVLAGIVAAHVLLETARDALFLTKLEPQALPFVYVAMAAIGLLTARGDRLISRLFGRKNALVLGLMGGATGTMLFYSDSMGQVRAFALYLWAGVITTLLTVQFWLSVAQRFTPAQGRRLFGLLAAGGVFGGVLGSGAGAILAQRFSIQSLLLASASLHLVTAWVVTAAPPATEVPIPPPRVGMVEGIGDLRRSSYLLRVGVLVQISVATLLLVDYVFKTVMATRLPAAELGVALARYYAVMNAVALVVQVFITMRILQRMGTILALTVLPLALLASGALGLLFGTTLLFVRLAKGADGALRFSLHRVSTELLFLPLSPEERARTKPLFDSVLSRATQALVAVGLWLGTRLFGASTLTFSFVTAGLAVVWVGLAWSLRTPYLERFRSTLGGSARRPGYTLFQLDLDSVAVLVEALSSPEENRVITAMSLFHEEGRSNLVPALVLYHPSPRVLVRALEVLPAPGRSDWIPLAERLLTHPDDQVRLAAIRALGSSGYLARVDPASFGDHPSLAASAAFFLAEASEEPAKHPALRALLSESGDLEGQITLLQAIARSNSARWTDALLALDALGRPGLDQALPPAMARTGDLRFVHPLIQRLSHRDGRNEVRDALVTFGDPALDALEVALYDRHTQPTLRLHIPRAISRFPSRRAGDILLEAMTRNLSGALRYKALRGLGRLVSSGAYTPASDRVLPLIEQFG